MTMILDSGVSFMSALFPWWMNAGEDSRTGSAPLQSPPAQRTHVNVLPQGCERLRPARARSAGSGLLARRAAASTFRRRRTARAHGGGLDSITDDAASLLAQLEGTGGGGGGGDPAGAPASGEPGAAPGLGGPFEPLASVQMTADDVFRRASVVDGPNSAQKLLKILGGLAMFPREQQLTMIRAMDAADETWDEKSVVADARQRQEALRAHMRRVTEERMAQAQALVAEIEGAKQAGAAVLAEIDKRIQELYTRREQEAAATTETISKLQQLDQQLRQQEEGSAAASRRWSTCWQPHRVLRGRRAGSGAAGPVLLSHGRGQEGAALPLGGVHALDQPRRHRGGRGRGGHHRPHVPRGDRAAAGRRTCGSSPTCRPSGPPSSARSTPRPCSTSARTAWSSSGAFTRARPRPRARSSPACS